MLNCWIFILVLKNKRSQSRNHVDFDKHLNDKEEGYDLPDGPTKSQISKELEDRGFHDIKLHSRADSINSNGTFNPILGYSESEPKRKRLREEYTEYVRNGLKEERSKSRSKSRRNQNIDDSRDDRSDYMTYYNEYAHKQRFQHSYFKYANGNPIIPSNISQTAVAMRKIDKEPNAYQAQVEDKYAKHGILK